MVVASNHRGLFVGTRRKSVPVTDLSPTNPSVPEHSGRRLLWHRCSLWIGEQYFFHELFLYLFRASFDCCRQFVSVIDSVGKKRTPKSPAVKQPTAKMGRPAVAGQARSSTVRVRFTPTERAALEVAAGDRSLSDWCREVLLAASRPTAR